MIPLKELFEKYKAIPVSAEATAEMLEAAYAIGFKAGQEDMRRIMEAAGVLEPTLAPSQP